MTDYKSPAPTSRPRSGLVVTLSNSRDGSYLLQFDDVSQQDRVGSGIGWESTSKFTDVSLDESQVRKMELTPQQFATIGESIVARLVATLID